MSSRKEKTDWPNYRTGLEKHFSILVRCHQLDCCHFQLSEYSNNLNEYTKKSVHFLCLVCGVSERLDEIFVRWWPSLDSRCLQPCRYQLPQQNYFNYLLWRVKVPLQTTCTFSSYKGKSLRTDREKLLSKCQNFVPTRKKKYASLFFIPLCHNQLTLMNVMIWQEIRFLKLLNWRLRLWVSWLRCCINVSSDPIDPAKYKRYWYRQMN